MGKILRIALPVALVFTGFGAFGVGPLAGMFGGAGGAGSLAGFQALSPGFQAVGAVGSFGNAGFFSTIFSKISAQIAANPLTSLFSGINALASIQSGLAQAEQAQIAAQQEERRLRSARIQAKQLEANALVAGNTARSSAIASAAGQGIETTTSRSFLAFLEEEEDSITRTVGSIQANAAAGFASSDLRIRAFGIRARQAQISGFATAGRSLFKDFA